METSSVLDYFFFPSLREISSKIFGRRSASMLSTMLAMAGSDAASAATSAELPSAPAATALAAIS